MIRKVFFAFLALALLAWVAGLSRGRLREKRRRLRRQASIPYAALSTGAIRGRRPSSRSGSNSGSSTSTDRGSSGRGSASSNRYGTSNGYQRGGNSDDGVPMGHSTYPFGVSRYTNSRNLQTPYSDQNPPGPGSSYGGQPFSGYQPVYSQIPNQYPPYRYGSTGGYAAVPPYGGGYVANPYNYGAGMPQTPYMNTNPWGQTTGYIGAGYGAAGGYGDVTSRSSIGSAYRDPNSPFTSWVHPRGETSNRYSGGASYGRGDSSGGSYYGSRYGDSTGRYVSGGSEGSYSSTNPYGSYRGGSAGSNPYSQSSSSQNQYTGYLGGGSSSGVGGAEYSGTNAGSSSYGGGQSAAGAGGAYPSGGSYGYGDSGETVGYGSQDAGDYGGAFGASNSYGDGDAYGGSYGGAGDNPYSQTSGSRYGLTSGSRYDSFGQSGRMRGSSRQSAQSYRGSQTGGSQSGGRTPSRFFTAESSNPSASEGYSSSRYSGRLGSGRDPSLQGTSRQPSRTSGTSRQPSRTSGRFFNPDEQPQPNSQSTVGSSSYQSGRFYNPQQGVSNSQDANTPRLVSSTYFNSVQEPQANSNAGQQPPSLPRGESAEALPQENYDNQQGTFLVGRRPDVPVPRQRNRTRNLHPSQRKCQELEDGLPDLSLDYKRMKRSVRLDRITLANLSCAMSEKADCLSASAYGNDRITLRRLLRFNTIAHNVGTADFLPNLHRNNWTFHACHKHWHSMKEFAHFHLFNVNGTLVGEGHKVSFCLQDSECSNPCKKSYDCKRNTQGISPGCRDVYEASYDCQWVDVTDVPTGMYTLRVTVNPVVDGVRAVPELSYTNNVVECKVEITVKGVETLECLPV